MIIYLSYLFIMKKFNYRIYIYLKFMYFDLIVSVCKLFALFNCMSIYSLKYILFNLGVFAFKLLSLLNVERGRVFIVSKIFILKLKFL